jgi:hypothetical protein
MIRIRIKITAIEAINTFATNFRVLNTTRTINNKFEKYISIEISTVLYNRCLPIIQNFKNQNIELVNSNSQDGLEMILSKIDKDKNILFWLDAHFPDADHNGASYRQYEKQLRIPLEDEIKIIKKYRKQSKDYLIIDDLRIYEDGNYEGGNWSDRKQYGGNGIDFIIDAFAETHNIKKLMNHEGYIVLEPK